MPVIKKVEIMIDGEQININREGLVAEDMIKVIGAVMYDMSSNLEGVSVADIAFDSTAYALNAFVNPALEADTDEIEPIVDEILEAE